MYTYISRVKICFSKTLVSDQLKDSRRAAVPGTQLIPGHAVSKVTTVFP